jgi:hypothetical protein
MHLAFELVPAQPSSHDGGGCVLCAASTSSSLHRCLHACVVCRVGVGVASY